MHRRLWTAEHRNRHGLQDHDDCIMCGQEPETASHLFLQCVLARQLWLKLLHLFCVVKALLFCVVKAHVEKWGGSVLHFFLCIFWSIEIKFRKKCIV